MSGTFIIIIVLIIAVAGILFLIWKNKKDRKQLNPDSQDSMKVERRDQDRSEDRI